MSDRTWTREEIQAMDRAEAKRLRRKLRNLRNAAVRCDCPSTYMGVSHVKPCPEAPK